MESCFQNSGSLQVVRKVETTSSQLASDTILQVPVLSPALAPRAPALLVAILHTTMPSQHQRARSRKFLRFPNASRLVEAKAVMVVMVAAVVAEITEALTAEAVTLRTILEVEHG